MNTYYTPTWKDAEGHVYFTLSQGDFKETEAEVTQMFDEYPEAKAMLAAMGVEFAGTFAFRTESLEAGVNVPHLKGTHPVLGPVAVIGGPAFDKAMGETPQNNETRKDLN